MNIKKLCLFLIFAGLLIGCSQERTEPVGVETKATFEELPHAYITIKAEGESDMPFPGVAKLWAKFYPEDEWTEVDSVEWDTNDPRPVLTCTIPINGRYIRWIGIQTGQTQPPNSWEDDTGYYGDWAQGGQDYFGDAIFNYR
jgi:hypothetical protein